MSSWRWNRSCVITVAATSLRQSDCFRDHTHTQVDAHKGFSLVTDQIKTTDKGTLLVVTSALAFFLSAVLDNLTTTIVMCSLLTKLITVSSSQALFVYSHGKDVSYACCKDSDGERDLVQEEGRRRIGLCTGPRLQGLSLLL